VSCLRDRTQTHLVFEDDSKWDAEEAIHIPDLFKAIDLCKDLPQELAQRDIARRSRKPLKELIFSGKWGTTAGLVW